MLLRDKDGLWPNLLAMFYILSGYLAGWYGLFSETLFLNLIGVLLLAHSMVIAAYMIHECAHNTLFAKNKWNERLGKILMWFTGACYGTYEDIRYKHFRHHVSRADVVAFDYRTRLARYPRLVSFLKMLEWFYIPAVEIMMHALVVVLPFVMPNRYQHRIRVIAVLLIRGGLFGLVAAINPLALVLYVAAYFLFMTVLRFMDVHQHTYEIFETLENKDVSGEKKFDREYEFRNTFSNIISVRYPWLNLLVLNFCYHNAHHEKPTVPWHKLPALHRELLADHPEQILPFSNLLKAYHEYRVPRILNDDEGDIGDLERGRRFIGVDGVSFLTAH